MNKIDLGELRSLGELKQYRTQSRARLQELDEQYRGQPFPDDVRSEFAGLSNQQDELDARIAELEARQGRIERAFRAGHYEGGSTGMSNGNGQHVDTAERWVTKEGKPVQLLRFGQPMRALDGYAEQPRLSWGKYLRGIMTGSWKGAELERSMAEGTGSAGGFLVPTPLSDQVIDKARNQVVCMRAGAQQVPMDAATLSVARVTGDPTVTPWHAEGGAITPSDLTFDHIVFTARTLAAICTLSVELAEDAANIDDVVTNALSKVLAIELDRACLRGSGTAPEPTGIRFQTGVGVDTTTFGANGSAITGTTPTGAVAWDWLSKAIFAVRQLNEYPNACIVSERTLGELDLLRASTGQPLPPPISVAGAVPSEAGLPPNAELPYGGRGIQLLSSNSVINTVTQGTASTASSAYVGDFTKLWIGMRRELVLETSRTASTPTTSMFGTLSVAIRAYIRADVQLQRPAAFRVVEGIL